MHIGAFAVFFVIVAFELFAVILSSIFAGLSFTPEDYIKTQAPSASSSPAFHLLLNSYS